jgi:O-antigen/teichoic acid export membrane protein
LSDQLVVTTDFVAHIQPTVGLRKRYAVKLVAAVAAALTGIAVDALGSRALGPADYGQYYFLQQFFTQILTLLSGSISLAFVVRTARRPGSQGFTFVYLAWLLAIPVLMEAFITLSEYTGFARLLWPDSAILYIHLGAIASYLLFLGREGTGMGDAYGLTVQSEWVRVVQRILAFALVIILFSIHWLGLKNFFLYNCFVNGTLVIALFVVLRRHGKLVFLRNPFRPICLRAAGKYFYDYSSPLVIYLLFATAAVVFDRWLLQVVAGNVNQGFFSLAAQISQMMMLFVTAFMPLLMREMSIAHGAADKERLRLLFKRSLENLYFLSGFLACFVAVFCDRISVLVGGKLFAASALPVALVVLSAMHRTCGQVTSTVYYAMGKTALFRNIAVITSLLGIALTYVLVGPTQYFGFGLGANGLALKTFLYEMIAVNIYAYFAAGCLGMRYWNIALQQLVCAGPLITVAGLVRLALSLLPTPSMEQVGLGFHIGIAGIFYTAIVMLVVYAWPRVAGLERDELERFKSRLVAKLRL